MAALYSVGSNSNKELGRGDLPHPQSAWGQVGSESDWAFLVSAYDNTLAINSLGHLYGWGVNGGRLGLGYSTPVNTPTRIGTDAGWQSAAMGETHAMGIRNGELYGWGSGQDYRNGSGTTSAVTTPTKCVFLVPSENAGFTKIVIAQGGNLAVRDTGGMYVCGAQTLGQFGVGTYDTITTFRRLHSDLDWVDVGAVQGTTYAKKSGGGFYAAGYNQGLHGDGTTDYSDVWKLITGFSPVVLPHGGGEAAFSVKADGTLWHTGSNSFYQRGTGSATPSVYLSWGQVGVATDWVDAAGTANNWVISCNAGGTLYGWGAGSSDYPYGPLSDVNRSTPQVVSGVTAGLVSPGSDYSVILEHAAQTEISEAPIIVLVHALEQADAPLSVVVSITTESTDAPITVTVVSWPHNEVAEAPITIAVSHVTETAEAQIRVLVRGTEQAEAAIAVAVTDGWPTVWSARVVLDGTDVTGRVTGAIRIRMEEGAARLANLALVPAASPINPIWYVGKPISVDFVHGAVPLRIFTGRVDLPSYDPDTRIVALSCTDDLQNRVAALSRAEIDALTGGGYHRAVHGEIDDNWDYAQASMLTHPAALDAGPHGGLRVTPWEGLPVWRTFDAVLDASMDLDLPRRQDIVNRVNVRFDYRYHRLRERSIGVAWHMAWFLPEAEAAGFRFPDAAGIMSALGGAGWTVRSAVFYPCPKQVNYAGGTVKTTGDTDSMAAVLGLRYGQTVTESASLTVTAPESIAGNGEIAQDLRCTLASEWTPDEWESDWTVAPANVGAGQDYAPDADRADAEAGMTSALAQAKTMILARHRNCRLAFDLPLTPALDVDRAVAVDAQVGTGRVQAEGKIWAVEHALDPDAGSAITRVTLALSGVAAAGLATPSVTPLTPPDPPDIDVATGADVYSPPHMLTMVAGQSPYFGNVGGWIVQAPETINVSTGAVPNPWYSPSAVYPETGFRVLLDGVSDSHRQPLEIASAKSYEIAIPADPLVMM